MKWSRRFFALGLALALSAGVSCTAADGPTGIPEAQPIEQPAYLLGDLLGGDGLLGSDGLVGGVVNGVVGTVVGITDLLVCTSQPYTVTRKTIGSDGGTIVVGSHTLVIPRGALSKNTTITAEQIPGTDQLLAVQSGRASLREASRPDNELPELPGCAAFEAHRIH